MRCNPRQCTQACLCYKKGLTGNVIGIKAVSQNKRFRLYRPLKQLNHTFGDRWFALKAEAFTRFFGTPTFLLRQTLVVGVWIYLNLAGFAKFASYPFIQLTRRERL